MVIYLVPELRRTTRSQHDATTRTAARCMVSNVPTLPCSWGLTGLTLNARALRTAVREPSYNYCTCTCRLLAA